MLDAVITRLPPGPVPEVPFLEQCKTAPRYACPCGHRKRYGDKVVGACGCSLRQGTPRVSADDDRETVRVVALLRRLTDDELYAAKAERALGVRVRLLALEELRRRERGP